jgi:hypothetical protein
MSVGRYPAPIPRLPTAARIRPNGVDGHSTERRQQLSDTSRDSVFPDFSPMMSVSVILLINAVVGRTSGSQRVVDTGALGNPDAV